MQKPTPKLRAGWWMLGAFAVSLAFSVGALMAFGTGTPGTIFGLKLTARWAYVFFWLAYVGGALAAVFGPRFQRVAWHGRELGLAFAAAMMPHTALVAWIFYISAISPMSRPKAIYFLVALLLTYILALLSFREVAARLNPVLIRRIRFVGVEYIALAFLRDFLGVPSKAGILQWLAYLPFIALALAAATLRIWTLRGDKPRKFRQLQHEKTV